MNPRAKIKPLGALLLALLVSACSGAGMLTIEDAWTRPTLQGNNAAVYLHIKNNSGMDDTLLAVSADIGRAVEIHESMAMDMGDDLDGMVAGSAEGSEGMAGMEMAGDVMQMVPLDSVALPRGASVSFEPGGKHIMLIGVDHDLQIGELIRIVLHFEVAGDISLDVPVVDR